MPDTIELIDLESMVNEADEPTCEDKHSVPECTVKVRYRASNCYVSDELICEALGLVIIEQLSSPSAVCLKCFHLVQHCWSIHPV